MEREKKTYPMWGVAPVLIPRLRFKNHTTKGVIETYVQSLKCVLWLCDILKERMFVKGLLIRSASKVIRNFEQYVNDMIYCCDNCYWYWERIKDALNQF